MTWMDLVTWRVATHLMVVRGNDCLLAHGGPKWLSPISGNCGVCVAFGYRPNVGYTQQQLVPCC